MRWRGTFAGIAVMAVLLGGCRVDDAPTPLTWRALDAPAGAQLTSMAAGSPLVVAGQVGGQPRLWQVSGTGWTPVPLHPASFYGSRAALVHVAASGAHLVALGRAVGGAHGNPRFSTWSGTASGLLETPQAFELFGGPRAIGLNDLAAGPAEDVVAGAWAPGTAPAGVAVWTGDGATYRRHDVEPGLRSSVSDQTSASAIAAQGDGFVVAGTTTHLGGGRIALHATAFWTAGPGSPWRRTALPSSGEASALDVACSASECLLAGVDGGRLALWRLDRQGGTRTVPLDSPPVLDEPADVAVTTGGWVVARSRHGTRLWRVAGASARPAQPPPVAVRALAVSGSQLYALAADGTLWSASAQPPAS